MRHGNAARPTISAARPGRQSHWGLVMSPLKTWGVVALLAAGFAGALWAADIPVVPYVEVSFATPGPLSLFCLPDGSGNPFTEAYNSLGQKVDGTLTLTLYDDFPPRGDPVPDFPREDIWLMDLQGTLVSCPGGLIPAANTDANGMTHWEQPALAGGRVDPGSGNGWTVFVVGWTLDAPGLIEFRANSADLDGNLAVTLTDVWLFTQAFFGPYDYAADFRWDGVVNLSDLALLAGSLEASCP